MQDNQSPNSSLLSPQQWLAVLLTLVILLLTVVLSILTVVQSENSLATNLVTIFGLVGGAVGVLALPFFQGSLRLLGAFLYTLRVTIGLLMRGLTEGFIKLIKHLPRRWYYALIILSLAANIFSLYNLVNSAQKSSILNCQDGNNTLQIIQEKNGEDIGISNGENCKIFTRPDISNAYQAEKEIYKNNPLITQPHMTLIVATMLSGDDTSSLSSGTALLQGVDIAQQEYNAQVSDYNQHLQEGQSKLLPLRLLIANAGSNEGYATTIARQIVQLARPGSSIIGVMGWPFSTDSAREALGILNDARVPGISSSLSSDSFSALSPYFFRVVPPNKQQAIAGASFLESKGVKHVVLCVDYHNDYSNSLANNFFTAFNRPGNTITKESYARGTLSHAKDPLGANATVLGKRILADVAAYPPEQTAVYFAGYANDLDLLRGFLSSPKSSKIVVMGGDGLDEYGADNPSTYSNYNDIYFTTFSSYPIWKYQAKQPCFLGDYQHHFDPNNVNNHLNFAFAKNDAILAYDAITAFLVAYESLPELARPNPSFEVIKSHLASTSFWGVSGQITLGSTGDPTNKALYINWVKSNTSPAEFISSSPASSMPGSSPIRFPLCGRIV